MKKILLFALIASFVSLGSVGTLQANLRSKCQSVGQYTPPKGVYRLHRRKINKRWEKRYHCLPCGRKIPYEVFVVTYKERYSNGTIRIWDCVQNGSEVSLGK